MRVKAALLGFLCCLSFLLLRSPQALAAQSLEHVGSFWGFNDAEFLPGGYVEENSDGEIHRYLYKNSKFEPFKGELPALIRDWSASNGLSDFVDQIDESDTLPGGIRSLLPRRARIKNWHIVPLADGKGDIALICYTRRISLATNGTDILVTAALNTNPNGVAPRFRKLWARKLVSEANYDDFQYQVVPGAGVFFLLYSDVVGGDAIEHHLDVYRMRALEPSKKYPKAK